MSLEKDDVVRMIYHHKFCIMKNYKELDASQWCFFARIGWPVERNSSRAVSYGESGSKVNDARVNDIIIYSSF